MTGFDTAALNGFKTSNYNIIKDSTDYKVTPVALTLYTSGSKVYGAAATTSNLNTITGTGWKNSDADILAAVANQTTLKGYVNNSKAAANGNHVIPADFTYTADRTTYWQGTPIPSQTGRVTNRYGEDVNDLVGSRNWETPATGMTAGTFYIFGHGANDNSGNYRPIQSTAPDNLTALVVKPMAKDPVIEGGVTDMLAGAWGPVRVPLLDIRYLHVEGTEGIDRWTGHVAPAKNFGEVVVYHGDEVKYEF